MVAQGAQGGTDIFVSGRESASLRGRKLFNGAYMSNIARRKSRTERRRREVFAAAVAVDVGSCSCCWKLREIFLLFNLIRIPTFYWRLWRRRCSNIKKKYAFAKISEQGEWQGQGKQQLGGVAVVAKAVGGRAKVEWRGRAKVKNA